MKEEKIFKVMGGMRAPIVLGKMIQEKAEEYARRQIMSDPHAKFYEVSEKGEKQIQLE
jgi:hypothetical protein